MASISSNLLSLTEAIKNININTVSNTSHSTNIRDNIKEEEHIRLKIEEHVNSELAVESDSEDEESKFD